MCKKSCISTKLRATEENMKIQCENRWKTSEALDYRKIVLAEMYYLILEAISVK